MRTTAPVQRIKVLATLGPACTDAATVRAMAEAGADGFRINASHTPVSDFPPLVQLVRAAEDAVGHPLAVLCDLAGPKLRVHPALAERQVQAGEELLLGPPGSGADVPVEGLELVAGLVPGARVLLHDGSLRLKVREVRDGGVVATAETAGRLAARGGVNLPELETALPALTQADLRAVEAGVAAGVDVFALSFVRRAADVEELRRQLDRLGSRAPVVAKLEKAQAVSPAALEAILASADMVWVARGDLGAETSPEQVPVLQKRIVRRAVQRGVPVAVATELLDSLTRVPRPTRAEASDVANAVFDGADALLLTAETAIGPYPVLAVETCVRIAAGAEAHSAFASPRPIPDPPSSSSRAIAEAVARAAVVAAGEVGAAAIVCFTASGRSARLLARHRPATPILALTPDATVARALALVWGVEPCLAPGAPPDHEGVVALAESLVLSRGLAAPGDVLVVTHGAPLSVRPATNLLRIHRCGEGS